MTLINILLLGFLMGLKHVLEADHVAAVAFFGFEGDIRQGGPCAGSGMGPGAHDHIICFRVGRLDDGYDSPRAVGPYLGVFCRVHAGVFMGGAVIKEIIFPS